MHLAKSRLSTCPVDLAQRFLARASLSSGPLLRVISGCGARQKPTARKLSYAKARLQVHAMFAKIGLSTKDYCTHSLRSGGASHASSKGVSKRLISAHGGWRSAKGPDGYIGDGKRSLLSVSQALKIKWLNIILYFTDIETSSYAFALWILWAECGLSYLKYHKTRLLLRENQVWKLCIISV